MLSLLLWSAAAGSCQLFQPVKCDSAVVEVGWGPRIDNAPAYSIVPQQSGYLLVIRVQGDRVAALYPGDPDHQHPVQAGDTVRVSDESGDFRNRAPGMSLVVLWSPQPIALRAYRDGSSWKDSALTSVWRGVLTGRPQVAMGERVMEFAGVLSGPLESIATLAPLPDLIDRRTRTVNLLAGWGSIYPSGGMTAYQAAHPAAPIPGVPFGQNSCAGRVYAISGSSGMGSGC